MTAIRRILVSALLIVPCWSARAQDRPLAWKLSPIFAVGGETDTAVVLDVLHAIDVVGAAGNRVGLLDHLNNQIILLDGNGRVERRIGRSGPGPGELTRPSGLVAAADGTLWTWDGARQALAGFTLDGKPVSRQLSVPGAGLVQTFALLGGGQLVTLRTRRDSINLWSIAAGTTQLLASVARPFPKSITPGDCPITDYPAYPVFSSALLWASRGSTVATNDGGTFTIHLHGGVHDGKTLSRDAALRKATVALAERELGPGYTMRMQDRREPCLVPATTILAGAGMADHIPAYRSLLFAGTDTLWAVRYSLPGEPRVADVYTVTRGYLGSIALGPVQPVAVRTDGSIISLEAKEGDVPRVVVYRVRH